MKKFLPIFIVITALLLVDFNVDASDRKNNRRRKTENKARERKDNDNVEELNRMEDKLQEPKKDDSKESDEERKERKEKAKEKMGKGEQTPSAVVSRVQRAFRLRRRLPDTAAEVSAPFVGHKRNMPAWMRILNSDEAVAWRG